ncbi:serine O-acetyltransferase [Ferrovum sp. PN-J185]|uniref:serine O-acetyltransferase n=1 Tax=Ferrovum sp. PN-J185 TaxID=1356306 RepID=UPI000797A034|nr:serine O-acetyltransferase [Ferrovum sp. PN-J185]KXW55289.1 serine acetyltransferase [Ferrovum sp. PN-J185]MCC6068646.1 serine O-acetyltransferase [Ferrovum sp. PN-J185]MDE1891652.1 serine O-acetyltransferase [Betaproteobacteria bacterium]MDE2055986.1 serine O-acetyltransferase [Betaproteobacteria bacterium]
MAIWSRVCEQIDIVFDRDPAVRSRWEVVSLYPGFHAILLHWLAHWLWGKQWFWLARFISQLSRGITGIEIHPGAKVGRRVFIDHGMGVVVGETAEIGDDCTLYQGVTLGGTSWQKGKRHPTLMPGVIVGAGAKIIGPIVIGEGAKVGSNAVVVKEVPQGATVIGIPGRVVEEDLSQKIKKEAMQFSAYGPTDNDKDPLVVLVNQLMEQCRELEEKSQELSKQLDSLNRSQEGH